jgi:hypothetical protein
MISIWKRNPKIWLQPFGYLSFDTIAIKSIIKAKWLSPARPTRSRSYHPSMASDARHWLRFDRHRTCTVRGFGPSKCTPPMSVDGGAANSNVVAVFGPVPTDGLPSATMSAIRQIGSIQRRWPPSSISACELRRTELSPLLRVLRTELGDDNVRRVFSTKLIMHPYRPLRIWAANVPMRGNRCRLSHRHATAQMIQPLSSGRL